MCTGAGAGSASRRLRRRFRRLGGFGAEPGHVQQGSGEGSGEGSREAVVQSQQGSGEGSGEGLGGCGAKPSQVQQGSGEGSGAGRVPEKVWEASVQSRVRFNRVKKKVPEKVWAALVQSQVRFNTQKGSARSSGEGLRGCAEPGQVQQGSGEGSREALVQESSGEGSGGCRARSGGLGRLWCRASQVKFNRVPEKVPEKVWEALVQSQVMFNRVPEKVRLWCKPGQVQQGSGEGSGEGLGGFGAEVFPALGFAARNRKICKNLHKNTTEAYCL